METASNATKHSFGFAAERPALLIDGFSRFVIRPAEEADVERLALRESEVEVTPWKEGDFRDSLQAGRPVLLLENEGDPEGFAAWAAFMPVLDEAELLIFGVRRDLQRRGIATRFLRRILDAAAVDGVRVVHLEVRKSNEPAIGLYEKLGFKTVGLRKGYYLVNGVREDAILMRLELEP